MSTRWDNNLRGSKPPDCEVKKTNESSDKQDNNQISIDENIQASRDSDAHFLHIIPQCSLSPKVSGNIIIDFENLKMICDKHFKKCIFCNKGRPQLVKDFYTGFATKLTVTCSKCKDNERKLMPVSYLSSKVNKMTIYDANSAKKITIFKWRSDTIPNNLKVTVMVLLLTVVLIQYNQTVW